MKNRQNSFAIAALPLTMCLAFLPAVAQTPRQHAERELAREVPTGSVEACSLITRDEIEKATGPDPFMDLESAGQGGWICNFVSGELKVYSGPESWEAWQSTLKGFKKEKEPTTPAPNFGERAYFLYLKPDNAYQDHVDFLVVESDNHTIVLSLDVPQGKPADSMRPALQSLMTTILSRLP